MTMTSGEHYWIQAATKACQGVDEATLKTLSVAALIREREELKAMLKRLDEQRKANGESCDWCYIFGSDPTAHTPTCRLAALVKEPANG